MDAREDESAPSDALSEDAAPSPKEWAPRSGSLASVLWPYYEQEFRLHSLRAAVAKSVSRGGVLRRVPPDWEPRFDHYSVAGATLAVPNVPRIEPPVFDWAGETARQVGSLVHAELQNFKLEGGNEASIRARGPHYRQWLSLQGVPADRLREAGERVVSALTAIQRDPRGLWILRDDHRDAQREKALSGLWGGEVVRVIFDRSFVDEAGVRWVIDYKTSLHQGSGIDEFLDREAQRYRAQMERYAAIAKNMGPEPVRVGLYFPLMCGWREWAP
jgi:ATP-dependent exoDNAse (exonuclease V) beta subunit